MYSIDIRACTNYRAYFVIVRINVTRYFRVFGLIVILILLLSPDRHPSLSCG